MSLMIPICVALHRYKKGTILQYETQIEFSLDSHIGRTAPIFAWSKHAPQAAALYKQVKTKYSHQVIKPSWHNGCNCARCAFDLVLSSIL